MSVSLAPDSDLSTSGPALAPKAAPGEDGASISRLQARANVGEALLRELVGEEYARIPEGASRGNNETLLILPRKGAHRLVVTFAGNTKKLVIPSELLENPEVQIIAIRDSTRSFALVGVPRLGETYEDCLGNIVKLGEMMGTTETYVVGVSSGGYPALRYALDLGARGVLTFSPPTTLDIENDPGSAIFKYPQLYRLYQKARHLAVDMAAAYEFAPVKPEGLIVYSDGHGRDAWLAERMRHIKGMKLMKIADEAGHKTYMWLVERSKVAPLFEKLLSMQPVAKD